MSSKGRYFTSLEEIYLENYKLVNAFIRDYYSDEETVKDISSIVWIKVMEEPDRYISMNEYWLQNYLRIVVRSVAVNQMRSEKAVRDLYRELEIFEGEQTEEVFTNELTEEEKNSYFIEAIKSLSYEEKQLLYMRVKKKSSFKELSELFEIPQSAVRMRQSRIISKLRKTVTTLMRENGDLDICCLLYTSPSPRDS